MTAMETRVAVVGAGSMGERHARVFSGAPGAILTCVYDVDLARAGAVASSWGGSVCAPCSTIDDAIEAADLVVLATPTELHEAQARRAIARGRHVLVEKPLCPTAARARELCELARGAGVRLLVGHSERFNPVVRALVAATADDPALVFQTERHGTARPTREEIGLNLAVHDVDLAAVLFRTAVSLARAGGDSDHAAIVVVALDGREAGIGVSHGAIRARAIHVQTARFVYEGDLLARTLLRDGERLVLDTAEPLALQARAALDALAGKTSAIATGEDGARAVAVAEHAMAITEGVAAE